jgi:Na+/H+ antiporter NhaD/arsenite permease-like protein
MNGLHIAIVVATLAGIALGGIPGLRMNRATIAVVGATLLIATGGFTLEEAYRAIDLNTIVLLFGMMVLNANLRLAGFFDLVAGRLARHAHSPRTLLAVITLPAGILSALFLNDTIVLVFTPLVLELTRAGGLPPLPFLVAVATAANVGSVATIIGNPQNMLVGVASGISFVRFLTVLAPVALVGLGLVWVVVYGLYRADLTPRPVAARPPEAKVYRPLLRKSTVATVVLLVALLAGVTPPLAALVAASLLLVTRRLQPEHVFEEIDWGLLVFFAALFVVSHGAATTGMSAALFGWMGTSVGSGLPGLAAVTAVLSNIVSNVPAVLLLQPTIPTLPDPDRAWLTVAMASTLAGNLTLMGSVANLIVAESARREGVRLSFLEYLRAGVPITLATLALGTGWLLLLP